MVIYHLKSWCPAARQRCHRRVDTYPLSTQQPWCRTRGHMRVATPTGSSGTARRATAAYHAADEQRDQEQHAGHDEQPEQALDDEANDARRNVDQDEEEDQREHRGLPA